MSLPILNVYVSSTWLDLRPEREAVERAIQRLRETKFVGMEYFGSRDETTRRASLDDVDRSHVYVLLVAGRYGSGITEAEYERATERGLPRFVYFKDDAAVPDERRETDPAQRAKLDAFREKLRANHLQTFDFTSPDDLAAKLTADLHRWLFDEYITPKLEGALSGQVPRYEAKALLDAVKDLSALNRDLLARLHGAGFNMAVAGNLNARDIITNIYNAPAVSAPTIPTLHQLRAPVGDFVGREKEIEQLLSALRGGASAAISGISGMGGIGKTELAFYVAERLRGVYTDAQLVVDMRGTDERPRDPADALTACIRAFLGPEQRLPDDLQGLTQIYRNVLDGKRALILLDNAHDSAQTRPLLPPAGSALLVTSRETVALPGMRRVTLEQLSATEARELLTGIAPRVPEDMADRICFLCGYLPLAIRAAGSLLDVTADLAPEKYAKQLEDERRRLELIGAEGVDLGVEASFGLSYARLTEDTARVFRRLAVFPATFDARAEETICEDPDHKHLSELVRRNLVRYNKDTQRYSLHDLARLFADSRMNEGEGRATRMHHAEQYLTVLRECDALYKKGGDAIKSGVALFDVERGNIEAGQEWACRHSREDEIAARLCNEYSNAGVYVLTLQRHPRENIRWFEAGLTVAQQLKDRAAEGRHLGNLGLAHSNLGDIRQAVEVYEQALVIFRETGDRHGESYILGNLGVAYRNLGDIRNAINLFDQVLLVAREMNDRSSEANALYSLGNVYVDLDDMRRSIEFYEQALIILRTIGYRREEGKVLGNLGAVYNAVNDARRAAQFYEQELVIAREFGDQRAERHALNGLGLIYGKLGDYQRAINYQRQSLSIAREFGDLLSEGITLFYISLTLDKLSDRTQAVAHAESALEIFEQIESPHAETARAQLARWRGQT